MCQSVHGQPVQSAAVSQMPSLSTGSSSPLLTGCGPLQPGRIPRTPVDVTLSAASERATRDTSMDQSEEKFFSLTPW